MIIRKITISNNTTTLRKLRQKTDKIIDERISTIANTKLEHLIWQEMMK